MDYKGFQLPDWDPDWGTLTCCSRTFSTNHRFQLHVTSHETEVERFWARVDKQPDHWLWGGFLHPKGGHGFFVVQRDGGRQQLHAHRYSYELLIGPISEGFHVHHDCRTPACVWPDHLELLTPSEHMRLHHPKIISREFCKYGHPQIAENVTTSTTGSPVCRPCYRDSAKRRRDKERATRLPKPPKPPRTQCKHGHLWIPENIYVGSNGAPTCRICTKEGNKRRLEEKRKHGISRV